MIRCVKIAPYELRPKDQDAYEYLVGVAAGVIDPPSLAPQSLSFPGHTVFYSPLRRCVESIDRTTARRVEEREELTEIPFDMSSFCTREQWGEQGSVLVRRKFKEAFIADTLPIGRSEILSGIERILHDAREANQTGPVVLVSHSFRLKLIEAFVRTDGRLAREPGLIEMYIHDDKKTYAFGEGFDID